MSDDFEWSRPGSPPPPNWTMAAPPTGPPTGPPPAPPGPGTTDPKSRRRGRTIRTAAIATVTAGALALVGVSVASAQSSGTTTPPSVAAPATTAPATTVPATPNPGENGGPRGFKGGRGFPGPGGPGFLGGFGAGGGGVIHGEVTRPNGTGFRTIDTQIGTVQAVSTSSIEVKSADNFDKTYSVTTNTVVNSGRDGIGSVKVGDTVQVEAVVTGKTTEAASVVDTTTLGNSRNHFQPAAPVTPSTPPTTTK